MSRTRVNQVESVVEDNWKVNNTTDEGVKAAYIRGWIGDKGTQY